MSASERTTGTDLYYGGLRRGSRGSRGQEYHHRVKRTGTGCKSTGTNAKLYKPPPIGKYVRLGVPEHTNTCRCEPVSRVPDAFRRADQANAIKAPAPGQTYRHRVQKYRHQCKTVQIAASRQSRESERVRAHECMQIRARISSTRCASPCGSSPYSKRTGTSAKVPAPMQNSTNRCQSAIKYVRACLSTRIHAGASPSLDYQTRSDVRIRPTR